MVCYNEGKIYKIVNDVNDMIYVGSTAEKTLSRRMSLHRAIIKKKMNRKLYSAMNEIGVEHFKIVLIELYPCKSKDELRAREEYYIRKLKPELNLCRAFLSDEERKNQKAEYQTIHKDRIKRYKNTYYQMNKDKILEQRKKYREINKENISNKSKKKYECNCGSIIRISDRHDHERTIKHNEAYDKGICKYKTIIFLD